jgi:hypothetical protein
VESCRDRTSAIGEPLAGTAETAPALVAISWPKPLWHDDDATLSRGLPPRVAEIARRQKRAGRKLPIRVFQRRPGQSTNRVEMLFFSREGGGLRSAMDVPAAQIPDRIERFLAGQAPGPKRSRPLLLVCTDGRHDRCCAMRGRALYEALARAHRREGSRIDLLESSHLGGHRFAATCLALPAGRHYGRLGPEHAGPLLRAVASGSVLAAHNRGVLGLPEAVQVAEAYLVARLPAMDRVVGGMPEAFGDGVRIGVTGYADSTPRRFRVYCARREFAGPTSCDGAAGSETRLRWVVRSVEELASGHGA